MAVPATQPVLDAFTTSVGKALAAARNARQHAGALRTVAPTTKARAAIAAVEDLLASAEVAATATAELGRQERAAQAQLYPTQGRDVQGAPQRPPHSPHVLGSRA